MGKEAILGRYAFLCGFVGLCGTGCLRTGETGLQGEGGRWQIGGFDRPGVVGGNGEQIGCRGGDVQRILDGIKDRGVGLFEGKAGSKSKGVGNEIDLWDNVELGFPVEGEIDRCIGEFIIKANNTGRAQVSIAILKTYIGAATQKPA